MGRKKSRKINVVYSTNPDYTYETESDQVEETPDPQNQQLRVWLDRKQRGGKVVSLIQGFVGTTEDLKNLASELKSLCGVGGSAKDGEIMIQGDHRDKIVAYLQNKGYGAKKAGG